METKEIQKLIDFIANSGLDEVKIETADLKISVKRSANTPVSAPQFVAAPPVQQLLPPSPQPQPSAAPVVAQQPATKNEEAKYLTIKSPMIGTFYRTPNPEKPSFVEVGDEISAGKTVCIIEAMKLFNEIESEISGRIVKILVENMTPVEFDQPLFLVEPN